MLFAGKEAATVLGKTLTGYADGSADPERRQNRPMARFLLDEPDADGRGSLTLTVDKSLYDRLTVGSHGRLSRLGSRCLEFTPDPEEGREEPASRPEPLPAEASNPCLSQYSPPPIGGWDGAQPPPLPAPRAEMACPWCGKPMTRWTLPSRDALILKRETAGDFSLKQWWRDREKNRIRLDGGPFADTSPLFQVCESCQRAVIDFAAPAPDPDSTPSPL